MKNFKKVLALLVAVLMIAASVSAFAAPATSQTIAAGNAADADGNYTISVADTDTHTYTVYQILTGTLIAGENKLGNPAWGSDATAPDGETAQQFIDRIASLSGVSLSEAVAAVKKADATGLTLSKTQSQNVVPGYYLIKDTTETLGDGDSYSLNIVAVFNDIQITPKKGTTTSDKKVDDKNDSNNTEDAETWQDSADYDIGDAVPFKLSATIADDYANYTHGYKLTFHDKQSAGLTFNANSVKVYVGETEIKTGFTVYENKTGTTLPTGMTWATDETFMIHFPNLKEISSVAAGTVITVKYNSTLNANAVVGKEGNPNTSYVTYTNNPNDNQGGENGKTPDDKVVVFTYKLDVDKINANGEPLTGAGFTLYKKNSAGTYVAVGDEVKGDEMTNFLWNGIDDGDYKLVETTTPAGYNTMDDIEFTISATHDAEANDPALTALTITGTDKLSASLTAGTFTKTKKDGDGKATTKDTVSGEITGEVINNQGSELPSTGGIGTTIFYIGGSILVLAAVILLVTKRRMGAED